MWSTIVNAINLNASENSFRIDHKQLITASELNTCYTISDDKQAFFVKLNDKQHLAHFENEAYNLEQIQNTNLFAPIKVIDRGTTLDKAYLILNHVDFHEGKTHHWYQLGQALAQMHKSTIHGQFGWQTDNYIGETLQPNAWQSNWRTFFSEQRIGWQLQLLQEKSIRIGNIDHIIKLCHDALLHHSVEPCLVHGDLWQGNVGFVNEQPAIFDPACYFGDREVDIAMSELFGHFPEAFYQGYQECYPLSERYEQRKIIYNFYHILNHANMFGGTYINQAKALLHRIMSMQLH